MANRANDPKSAEEVGGSLLSVDGHSVLHELCEVRQLVSLPGHRLCFIAFHQMIFVIIRGRKVPARQLALTCS